MSLLLLSFAYAAPLHAIDGELVDPGPGTVLVAWRLDDLDSLAALREATRAGRPVVAVNEDAAGDRARLEGWLRAQGLDLAIVADPEHAVAARFGLVVGEAGVIDAQGRLASLDSIGVRVAGR